MTSHSSRVLNLISQKKKKTKTRHKQIETKKKNKNSKRKQEAAGNGHANGSTLKSNGSADGSSKNSSSTMVKTFQAYLPPSNRTYSCVHCRAHLASHDELISKVRKQSTMKPINYKLLKTDPKCKQNCAFTKQTPIELPNFML